MSSSERVARAERALPPREAVLLWLEGAREHRDLESYARSLVVEGTGLSPFDVIADRVLPRAPAQARASREDSSAASSRAVRDVAFLFGLVVCLNDTAQTVAREGWLRGLLVARTLGDDADEDGARGPSDVAAASLDLVREVRTEGSALGLLERRYFRGRPVLFREPAEAWARVQVQMDMVEVLSSVSQGPLGVGRRRSHGNQGSKAPGAARAAELEDDARIFAFGLLGEPLRARAIAQDRLRKSTAGGAG